MSKEITEQLKYYKQKHDWESIVRMFDLTQDISWFLKHLTIDELSELTYAITQHISNMIGETKKLKNNIDINFTLKQVIIEYQFLQKVINNIDYNKNIFNAFAYINKQLFDNLNRDINNLIKKSQNPIDKDIIIAKSQLFNNIINCENAIKYYIILRDNHPNDIKILYRFAHLLSSINDYHFGKGKSIKDLKLRKEDKWITSFAMRTKTAGFYYNQVIKLYEELDSDLKRQIYRNVYIKSEFGLVRAVTDLYKSCFSVNKVYKCANDNSKLTQNDIIYDLSEIHADIIRMIYYMNNIFEQTKLPSRRLSENEIQEIANMENEPEKPFDIYYRQGLTDILVAECAYVDFPNIKSKTSDECMQSFIKRMKHAIDMFQNASEIKAERKRLNKQDIGGFLWEIAQLGFCFSVLGLIDSVYNEELVKLINKYNKRKGISFENLTQTLYYYTALGYIYNKHTYDLQKAIHYLKLITNKQCPQYNQAKKLLQNIIEKNV